MATIEIDDALRQRLVRLEDEWGAPNLSVVIERVLAHALASPMPFPKAKAPKRTATTRAPQTGRKGTAR